MTNTLMIEMAIWRTVYPDLHLPTFIMKLPCFMTFAPRKKKNDRTVAVAYDFENLLEDESSVVIKLLNFYLLKSLNIECRSAPKNCDSKEMRTCPNPCPESLPTPANSPNLESKINTLCTSGLNAPMS